MVFPCGRWLLLCCLISDLCCSPGTWNVIDFGLARRYVDDHGQLLPERKDAAFRGSSTYASVNAHLLTDLGRRDDLWSWFFMTVEALEGALPWRDFKDAGDNEAAR